MSEEWRPVVGYEGFYEVERGGEIRSLDRITFGRNKSTRVVKGRVLKPWLVEGYSRVGLRDAGKQKHIHVHRVVAEAFIPNPDNLPLVRHLNDIRTDNRVENLAWGTVSDNEHDKVRNGKNRKANQTHCIRGHGFSEDNTRIDRDGCRQCRTCDKIRNDRWRAKRKMKEEEN